MAMAGDDPFRIASLVPVTTPPGMRETEAPLPPLADERVLLAELETEIAAIDAELASLDAPG
jgi:hypothetical protein